MSVNERMVKIAITIVMLAVSAAMICYVLVDVARRLHSRERCVAVLYEDSIRCDNGVDHYRQTVKIESPDDVERLELAPYAGGPDSVAGTFMRQFTSPLEAPIIRPSGLDA